MLECLLTEVTPIVDHVIVVEASETFTGRMRSMVRTPFSGVRLGRFREQVTYRTIGLPVGTPWEREAAARQACWDIALGDNDAPRRIEPADLFMHGDVDEIPRRTEIWHDGPTPHTLIMRHHIFNLSWLARPIWGPFIFTANQFSGNLGKMRSDRTGPTFEHRDDDAAWHLSWFGGERDRRRKLRAFSHTEHVAELEPLLASMPLTGNTPEWWQGQMEQTPREMMRDMPEYVLSGACPKHWRKEP